MDETYRPINGLQLWAIRSEDESRAISELERLPDRSAAIVGAALLEGHVETILRQELSGGDEGTFKDMSTGSGPFSAFNTKVRLLYLLGLLTAEAKKDLELLIKVRNKFAHELRVDTFDHDLVRNNCLNLKIVERFVMEEFNSAPTLRQDSPRIVFHGANETLKDPRSKFFLSISAFTVALNSYPRQGERTPYL